MLQSPWLDESDPSVAPNQFDEFPSGEHEVTGIFGYVSKDDQGVPFYKERDGRPYTMLKLRLVDGSEGPPISCSPGEIPTLVAAFAGEAAVQYLPRDTKSVAFLLKAIELANCTAPEMAGRVPSKQTCYVSKKGYVRNVSGMHLPVDRLFRFVVDDLRNLDGTIDPLHFMLHEGFHQHVMNIRFRVVGDMAGAPTIYDNATVTVVLEQPFAGTREVTNAEGQTVVMPVTKVNQNKSRPRSVSRFFTLVNVFAPEVSNHEWISDPARSPFGTNEPENPIVVVNHYLRQVQRVGVAKMTVSQKSTKNPVRLDIADFVPLDGTAPIPVTQVQSRTNLRELYRAISDYVAGAFVPGSGEFPSMTPVGAEWAKTKMLPIWENLGLPGEHRLADLNEDQATMLLGSLITELGWPKTAPKTTGIPGSSDF